MTNIFLGVVALCFVAGFSLSFTPLRRGAQRCIYWACAVVAAVAGFGMEYPKWQNGLWTAAFVVAAMALAAFRFTSYIKIRGKIYAFSPDLRRGDPDDTYTAPAGADEGAGADGAPVAQPDSDPVPDSYSGMLTPTALWWMMVALTVIAAINVYAFLFSNGGTAPAAVMGAFVALLALVLGYGDGSWGYPVARGRTLPFVVTSVITAGTFAIVYLIAYYTARRRPLRRQQSMEYRAHPRHQR
jgi:hypothetical protein